MKILTERHQKGLYKFTVKNQGTEKFAWLMYWEGSRKTLIIGVGDTIGECVTEAIDTIESEVYEHLKASSNEASQPTN